MSGAMREKDEADYDLERFVEMFDQAIISDDPRVKNALRQLMMMVILTDTGDREAGIRASHGPLRRLQEDMREQFKWIKRLEDQVQSLKNQLSYNEMQRKQSSGGFRAQDYPDVYPEQTITPKEYWHSVIAQTNQQKEIKNYPSALNNLNIKVAKDTGEK